jgi:hypothetical protein
MTLYFARTFQLSSSAHEYLKEQGICRYITIGPTQYVRRGVQLEYLELTVRRRQVGEVLVVEGRAPACRLVWSGMQYRRSQAFITELEMSACAESKRMTNHNTPQLSGMDSANHCAAFPGLSALSTTTVDNFESATSQSASSIPAVPHGRMQPGRYANDTRNQLVIIQTLSLISIASDGSGDEYVAMCGCK